MRTSAPRRWLSFDPTLIGFIAAAVVALALVASTQWLAWQQREAADGALQSQAALGVLADTCAAQVDIQNGHRGRAAHRAGESARRRAAALAERDAGSAGGAAHARAARRQRRAGARPAAGRPG